MSSAAAEAEKKLLEKEAEKRAIEEAKAKAKKMQEEKKKKAAEEDAKRKADEEAAAVAAGGKKEYKKGQEVWYDNGEDWVEAVIVKMGELLTVEVRDTGERVNDVERDWISPMEYEDDPNEAEAQEEEEEEDSGLGMLAGMAADSSVSSSSSKSAGVAAKEAKAAAAAKKAKEMAAAARKAQEDAAKKKRSGIMGMASGKGFGGRKSHMAKFAVEVDPEVASDSLHRARTARMSYAAMITYASFHAGSKEVRHSAHARGVNAGASLAFCVPSSLSQALEQMT